MVLIHCELPQKNIKKIKSIDKIFEYFCLETTIAKINQRTAYETYRYRNSIIGWNK